MPASEGVPQGGVISPLLSNIMLHEFDVWMEANYLSKKVRKDRWAWNFGILTQRPIAVRENRQWKPGVSYCRYADDFVDCRQGNQNTCSGNTRSVPDVSGRSAELTLNMEKTHITHVNDGFVFLGHSIIRKRGRGVACDLSRRSRGRSTGDLPAKLVKQLSGNYSVNHMDLMERLNRQISGWANFYRYTDYTATMFSQVDRTVFWKFGYWLARKYRRGFPILMREHVRAPELGQVNHMGTEGQNGRGLVWGTVRFGAW
jgi:RNA-directed DNA polymerase